MFSWMLCPYFDHARARAEAEDPGRMADITDPQSRVQPLRGGGWVQGCNCQAVFAAGGLILANDVGINLVDNQYCRDMVEGKPSLQRD
jgi:hypothetical protein